MNGKEFSINYASAFLENFKGSERFVSLRIQFHDGKKIDKIFCDKFYRQTFTFLQDYLHVGDEDSCSASGFNPLHSGL